MRENLHSLQDNDWTTAGTTTGDMPSHGVPFLNATAIDTTTLALATTPSLPTNSMEACAQGFFFTQPVSMRQLVVVLSYYSSCYAAGLSYLSLWHPA